jgi:thiosulfate/3-mercaptopyruvate sulfurtransferase
VDGGIDALIQSETLPINLPPLSGDFTVTRDLRFQITKDELRNSIGKAGIAILDVREPREYAGETPYGESRGGHVPGAKHFSIRPYWIRTGRPCPATKSRASSPKSE